jgi:hypothetical protein
MVQSHLLLGWFLDGGVREEAGSFCCPADVDEEVPAAEVALNTSLPPSSVENNC